MSASAGFVELLMDALSGLGPVSVRRMFGGAGVYADGVMFGLVADDTLYLKADDETKRAFEAEGLEPFGYQGRTKRIDLPYWRAPERLLDDPDEMVAWARTALAVARRAAAAKPKRQRKGGAEPGQKGRSRI
jgi:DNA transformation protein and related proteins